VKQSQAALLALAVSAFAIGTAEFVIMGLLPQVARNLAVSVPAAGWLISGYALGVCIGAPIMAIATQRLPRRAALLLLMAIFVLGNGLCALAPSYGLLMAGRVVTALCHGTFFGVGAVTAAGLVPAEKRGQAMALMFSGLTLANVLGVPLGTALGQAAGWRSTFWAVATIGVAAFGALWALLPRETAAQAPPAAMRELASLRGPVWLALGISVVGSASMFALFTYIAPILNDITGLSPRGVTYTLFLIGLGMTAGNLIGGRLADWRLGITIMGAFLVSAALLALLTMSATTLWITELLLLLWAAVTFASCAALQINAVVLGSAAPNLISTLNIGAFNAGNALGAWVGGEVIARGFALGMIPAAAAGLAALALVLTALSFRGRGTEAKAAAGVGALTRRADV
jgi:DHA1 family inner membrane transport protein